jgi:hypothetical protein
MKSPATLDRRRITDPYRRYPAKGSRGTFACNVSSGLIADRFGA